MRIASGPQSVREALKNENGAQNPDESDSRTSGVSQASLWHQKIHLQLGQSALGSGVSGLQAGAGHASRSGAHPQASQGDEPQKTIQRATGNGLSLDLRRDQVRGGGSQIGRAHV